MKYHPCRIASGPNGQPLVSDGKPTTYAELLELVLSTTPPKPEQRLEAYRIMQALATLPRDAEGVVAAGEPGPRPLELEAKQVVLLKDLALQCTTLTTLGYGVLHDWLEGKNEPH